MFVESLIVEDSRADSARERIDEIEFLSKLPTRLEETERNRPKSTPVQQRAHGTRPPER